MMEITKNALNARLAEVEAISKMIGVRMDGNLSAGALADLLNRDLNARMQDYSEYVDDETERILITNEPRTPETLMLEVYLGIVNKDNWKEWAELNREDVQKVIGYYVTMLAGAESMDGGLNAVESYRATLLHGAELLEMNGGYEWLGLVDAVTMN